MRASALATVRAGNVIGGGDFSPGRLLPDLVRAFAAGVPAELRHPDGVRPWQHVLDALAGYLLLAERLAANPASFSTAWNFGPDEDDELDRGQDRRGRGRALRRRRLAVGGERSRARGADAAPVLRAGPPLARLAHAAVDGAGGRVGDRRLPGAAARARHELADRADPGLSRRSIGCRARSGWRRESGPSASMPTPEPAEVPIFVLCGGLGSRLGEIAAARPKPMLDIGEKPMLLHIMGWYARFGFRRFVLCTGHRSEVISGYFANFAALNSDFTVDLADRNITYHQPDQLPAWNVTVAFTGAAAMTGAQDRPGGRPLSGRRRSISASPTATASPTPISATSSASISPMPGSAPCWACIRPRQFGRMALHEDGSASFAEKPSRTSEVVNGGFFFFRRGLLDYLSDDDSCVLEREPLQRLTAEAQLTAYQHGGFWSCVDTLRDREVVQGLWEAGAAPWKG